MAEEIEFVAMPPDSQNFSANPVCTKPDYVVETRGQNAPPPPPTTAAQPMSSPAPPPKK
jgi:hypothetical protein